MLTTDRVEVGENSFSYYVHSEGEEIFVFINGWCSSRYFWEPIISNFFEYGRCISLDLIGHYPGIASPNFSNLSIEELIGIQAEAVRKIADGRKVTLVGHSTGGTFCIGVASMLPDVIQSVIAISPAVHGPVRGLLVPAMLASELKLGFINDMTMKLIGLSQELMDFWFSVAVYDKESFFEITGIKDFLATYQKNFRKLNSGVMSSFLQKLDKTDARDLVKNYTIPTMIIFGEDDKIVPSIQGAKLAASIPSSKLVIYEKSGHIPILEQKEKCLSDIKNWLTLLR
jgi:pimeloyl-ACP methyl ester carboxylesterase